MYQLGNQKDNHIACCVCRVFQQNTSTQVLQQWLEAQLFEAIFECVHGVLSEEYVWLYHQTCTSQGPHYIMLTSSYEHYIMPLIDSYDIPKWSSDDSEDDSKMVSDLHTMSCKKSGQPLEKVCWPKSSMETQPGCG